MSFSHQIYSSRGGGNQDDIRGLQSSGSSLGLSAGFLDLVLDCSFVFLNLVILSIGICFVNHFLLRLEFNKVLVFLAASISRAVSVFVQVFALGGLVGSGLEVGGVVNGDILLRALSSYEKTSGVDQSLALLKF